MPATWRWCARISRKFPIVLASATPSVETEVNARKGRYQRVALPSRFGGQHMPHIEAIDLRREAPARGRFISPRLAEADRRSPLNGASRRCCFSIAAATRR